MIVYLKNSTVHLSFMQIRPKCCFLRFSGVRHRKWTLLGHAFKASRVESSRVEMPPKKTAPPKKTTKTAVLLTRTSSSPGRTPWRVATSGKETGQGNRAESEAHAARTVHSRSDEAGVTDCQTSPICAQLIVETTDEIEGQKALLCVGSCNQWYHHW